MAGKEDLLPNARNTPIGKQNNIANAEIIKVRDNPPHAAVSTYFKPKFRNWTKSPYQRVFKTKSTQYFL